MTENRAPRGDRLVFLRDGTAAAAAAAASGVAAAAVGLVAVPRMPVGGSRREKGGSLWLAEQRRLRAVRESQEQARAGAGAGAKHCWVRDPRWPGRHAGLLLGWERSGDGWLGRVALVPDADAELVVALVPGVYLEDAGPRARQDG